MASQSRTIRVRFDGNADGLSKAAERGTKAVEKFQENLPDIGKKSGSGFSDKFMGGLKDGIGKAVPGFLSEFGSSFTGGLKGVISSPVIGPIVIAALVGVAALLAPVAATVIGGAIVAGFGAGLVGLGAMVLLENEKIKKQFSATFADIKGTLTEAFQPLVPVLDTVRKVLKGVVDQLAPFIERGVKLAQGPLKAFVEQLGQAFVKIGPAIEPMMKAFGDILNVVGPLLPPLFQLISDQLITLSGSISENKETFGLLITFLVTSIPFVIQVITFLVQAFFSIVEGAKAVWTNVSSAFTNIQSTVSSVIATVSSVITSGFNAVKSFVSSTWSSISSAVSSAINAVKGFVSSGVKAVQSAWNSAWSSAKSAVSSAWSNIKSSVSTGVNNVVSFVRGLPGKIKSALGNLGSLLYQAGANVINGLINGIQSRIGAIRAKIASVAQTIRNHLPFSPAKEGPLSGSGNPENSGRSIGRMLASGIGSEQGNVKSAMNDLLSGGFNSRAVLSSPQASSVFTPTATATHLQSGEPTPVEVRVFIGDRELSDIVRVEMSERDRNVKRRALAGVAR